MNGPPNSSLTKSGPWPADDVAALRRLVAGGCSDGEIAQRLGRPRESVRDRRHALDLEPGRNPRLTAMLARLHKRRRIRGR